VFPDSITFSWGGAIEGTDGSFFGTSQQGGTNGAGTIYRVTRDGVFTVVVSLDPNGGGYPSARLIQGIDGAFYGTGGGGEGYGTIFRLTVPSARAPKLKAPGSLGSETVLSWSAIRGRKYQVQTTTNLAGLNWENAGGVVTATNSFNAWSSSARSAPQTFYRVMMLP